MDKKELLQKLQQIKKSTKEIIERRKGNESTTGEVKTDQEKS